ncbi:MAG: phosphoglucomutase, partial [Actinomycetota bacterium]
MSRDSSRDIAEKWLMAEPDEDIRRELIELIKGSDEDGSVEELDERFAGRLMFGTAGLRAEVGAGPLRMNRLVVRQA